jgi:hypothetical protein
VQATAQAVGRRVLTAHVGYSCWLVAQDSVHKCIAVRCVSAVKCVIIILSKAFGVMVDCFMKCGSAHMGARCAVQCT